MYFQYYSGYILEILATLHGICSSNRGHSIPEMYFKYYLYYTGYVVEILTTQKKIRT